TCKPARSAQAGAGASSEPCGSAASACPQRATVARSAGTEASATGAGSQTEIARYASTDGRATAAGTPNRINMPTIPPVTDPGIGSVLATCPTKYASATTGSSEGEPNARSIAHSTAASKVQ